MICILGSRPDRVNRRPLRVRLNALKNSPKVPVASIHIHPSFEEREALQFSYFFGDVAILRLIDPVDTAALHTACLPYDVSTINERDCYVTGRGYLRATGSYKKTANIK